MGHLLQGYPVGFGKLPPEYGVKFEPGEFFQEANKFASLKFPVAFRVVCTAMEHVKLHYYMSHPDVNPH